MGNGLLGLSDDHGRELPLRGETNRKSFKVWQLHTASCMYLGADARLPTYSAEYGRRS